MSFLCTRWRPFGASEGKRWADAVNSVFVNGRPRPAIMENMRKRIDRGDVGAERQEAIQAMCDIARDRATKLQA